MMKKRHAHALFHTVSQENFGFPISNTKEAGIEGNTIAQHQFKNFDQ
jgi:hypothetical protein